MYQGLHASVNAWEGHHTVSGVLCEGFFDKEIRSRKVSSEALDSDSALVSPQQVVLSHHKDAPFSFCGEETGRGGQARRCRSDQTCQNTL